MHIRISREIDSLKGKIERKREREREREKKKKTYYGSLPYFHAVRPFSVSSGSNLYMDVRIILHS